MVLIDEKDTAVYQKRLPNNLKMICEQLSPYGNQLQGMAVESTFNWYWLVDGLMEAGHKVHLVNTAAVQQYNGLKFTDDEHDAWWLAHLLRLGILPEGMMETGDIKWFSEVGHYASYCRCVDSKKTSNFKKKGEGNRKNGNKYLSWAFPGFPRVISLSVQIC